MQAKQQKRKYVYYNNYDEWFTKIKPYDLICFGPKPSNSEPCCSPARWISRLILCFEDVELGCHNTTSWSHVGVIVPNYGFDFGQEKDEYKENELFILESVISGKINDGVPELISGKGANGVQVRDLRKVVTQALLSNNQVGIIHLRESNRNIFHQQAQSFYDENKYAWFDFFHCCKAICCFPFFRFLINRFICCIIPDNASMFCSEMATRFYQSLGLIPYFIDPENCSPQELVDLSGDLKDVGYDFFCPIAYVLTSDE